MAGMHLRQTVGWRSPPSASPVTSPERRPSASPQSVGDDDGDPLSLMMGEILREFAADGILITQQEEHGESLVLFSEGACEPENDAFHGDADALSAWQVMPGDVSAAMLTTRMPASGGTITVRTVFRRVSDATKAQARVVSARLQPLLQPFARAWRQQHRIQARVRALTHAIDRTDIGVVLIDAAGVPAFVNAAARALIAAGDGLRMRGTMLVGATLADTLRLHAAVEHVVNAAGGDNPEPVVALPRANRRPLMAAVVAGGADRSGRSATTGEEPAAILYLFDPEEDLATLVEPACKLYGLSPVETRLTCLLADGRSLSDAAQAMRVREMTARSYLKQIFLKTATNRQAELVWLMLKSTIRTRRANAPGTTLAALV